MAGPLLPLASRYVIHGDGFEAGHGGGGDPDCQICDVGDRIRPNRWRIYTVMGWDDTDARGFLCLCSSPMLWRPPPLSSCSPAHGLVCAAGTLDRRLEREHALTKAQIWAGLARPWAPRNLEPWTISSPRARWDWWLRVSGRPW